MAINPIKLTGTWDEGYAIDVHIISSKYTGNDVYGYPVFDNKYSEMGQLLHQYKYNNQQSKLADIIELTKPFIKSWAAISEVDFVLPVPPSKSRIYQPTQEIAREIAMLIGVGYSDEILKKESAIESKGLSEPEKQQVYDSIIQTKKAVKSHNMLLVDDLYQTGTTLEACVRVLRKDSNIMKIYVLTMTKTRKR